MVIAALIYLVKSIDIVPDMVLGIGLLDDISVFTYLMTKIKSEIDKYEKNGNNNQHWKFVKRDFYLRDTLTVARELLGKYLISKKDDEILIAKIVEVEAYLEDMKTKQLILMVGGELKGQKLCMGTQELHMYISPMECTTY